MASRSLGSYRQVYLIRVGVKLCRTPALQDQSCLSLPQKNHFWFHKEPSLFFNLFIIWRTFVCHKEPFEKQKGSSDVKGSLWNQLDKKVLPWRCEAPLLLYYCGKCDAWHRNVPKKHNWNNNNNNIYIFLLHYCIANSVLSYCILLE